MRFITLCCLIVAIYFTALFIYMITLPVNKKNNPSPVDVLLYIPIEITLIIAIICWIIFYLLYVSQHTSISNNI